MKKIYNFCMIRHDYVDWFQCAKVDFLSDAPVTLQDLERPTTEESRDLQDRALQDPERSFVKASKFLRDHTLQDLEHTATEE